MGSGNLRNKPCLCGSDKKFKNCHGKKDNKIPPELFSQYLSGQYNNTRPKTCLLGSLNDCTKNIIRAHTISKHKHLDQITSDGHILEFDKFSDDSAASDKMKLTGRRAATTFTGLCDKHDQIFQPIDELDYDNTNEKQIFLFALRALLKEIFSKRHSIQLYSKIISDGFIPATNDLESFLKTQKSIDAHSENFLKPFLKGFKNNDYSFLETISFHFSIKSQCVVSSMFDPTFNLNMEMIQDPRELDDKAKILFLNVFSENNNSHVILSSFKSDKLITEHFNKILTLSSDIQQNIINNMIVRNTEVLCINPNFWDSIPKNKKVKFQDEFMQTAFVQTNDSLFNPPNVNFFTH